MKWNACLISFNIENEEKNSQCRVEQNRETLEKIDNRPSKTFIRFVIYWEFFFVLLTLLLLVDSSRHTYWIKSLKIKSINFPKKKEKGKLTKFKIQQHLMPSSYNEAEDGWNCDNDGTRGPKTVRMVQERIFKFWYFHSVFSLKNFQLHNLFGVQNKHKKIRW